MATWDSTIRGKLMNTRTTMRTVARSGWRLAIFVSTLLLISALPREAAAQTANATLRGKAPATATVTATNTDTGLTRKTQAAADGSYTLVGLPPGPYQVDAGPGTERIVTLVVASTATLDLESAAEAASLGEVIVSGARLSDVKTSEVASGISLHQIQT